MAHDGDAVGGPNDAVVRATRHGTFGITTVRHRHRQARFSTWKLRENRQAKATIAGGWGADKLTSGRRRTLLMGGGGGADRLISRSSIPSVLDGGHGADKFYTRFSGCEVLARRGDGDCLITAAAIIPVEKYGTFGFADENSPTPGKCFYLVNGEDGKPADVLA